VSALRGPRSVAELLPRPFADLTVADVRQLIAHVGEERETLYFERKRAVTAQSLAKSCAAFANTYGGLLLVGVEDAGDELVGVDAIGEPQVWVKDVLRAHVLPMPAFRARFLPLDDRAGRGLLLVLVEESSTTPHLLTRAGAIYVRNPGSSDPRPIGDQSLLLDLTTRGREARDLAGRRAHEALEHRWNSWRLYTLGLAPTGSQADVVRDLYRRPKDASLLREVTMIHELEPASSANMGEPSREWFTEVNWSLGRVALARHVLRSFPLEPERFLDGVVVDSDCVLQVQRCLLVADEHESHPEPRGPRPIGLDDALGVVPWFSEALRRGRELILSLGGHGDLRIALHVDTGGRFVFYAESRAKPAAHDFRVSYWARLEAEAERELALAEQLRQDLGRHIGAAPDR
jgi:hypothetical protein